MINFQGLLLTRQLLDMRQHLARTALRAIAHLAAQYQAKYNADDTARNKSVEEWRASNQLISLPKEPAQPEEQHRNSDAYKQAVKKMNKPDKQYESGKINIDQYDAEYENIRKTIYRADLDSSVRYSSNGKKYVKEYLNHYGKDLNIAYLKDLGYDEQTAKEFTKRIMKANNKMLNGM